MVGQALGKVNVKFRSCAESAGVTECGHLTPEEESPDPHAMLLAEPHACPRWRVTKSVGQCPEAPRLLGPGVRSQNGKPYPGPNPSPYPYFSL